MPTKDVYVVCGRNELLTQYPELADELEEEIKRMEKENLEKQARIEALESKVSNHDSADQNTKDLDMDIFFCVATVCSRRVLLLIPYITTLATLGN